MVGGTALKSYNPNTEDGEQYLTQETRFTSALYNNDKPQIAAALRDLRETPSSSSSASTGPVVPLHTNAAPVDSSVFQSQKRTPSEDNAEGNQTSRRRRRSPSCSHPCMECPTDRPQGKCVHKAGHENSPWKEHICQRCIDFEEDPTGQSSRPALVHDDRVHSLIENGKTSPTTQSVVEHGPRPRCQCICDCPHRPARGNRWQCTSHCEALVCQSCVAHWRPVICHWCFNPFC